ncbi:MAG TPA: glycoside hydrolase family 88 protein [Actinopolymorphaceae bacterium]|jgi:rhamnogalacturonyl hydrolase YesR
MAGQPVRSGDGPEAERVEVATVEQVAAVTAAYPFKIWGFGEGPALAALLRVGQLAERADLVARVAELVLPSLRRPPDPTDHLIAVEVLLGLRSLRGDVTTQIDDVCDRWVATIRDAPRRTPGGPRLHRPDLQAWSSTIWVDCMHTDGPGLLALGHVDEAVTYAKEYARVLQRSDGLFHHGYDVVSERGNGVAWGRGQGWALLGLVEVAAGTRDDELAGRLRQLVDALAEHEMDGRWRTVVDDPEAPLENSVSAFVAFGVRRAVAHGLVDQRHAAMAERAFAAAVQETVDGRLLVSDATPVGDAVSYRHRGLGAFPWGQGPLLLAMLERVKGLEGVEGETS